MQFDDENEATVSELARVFWPATSMDLSPSYELVKGGHFSRDFPATLFYSNIADFEFGHVSFHWHEYLEMIVVSEGRTDATVGGTTIRLEKGDGLFVNQQVPHTYQPPDDPIDDVHIGFFFSPTLIAEKGSYIYEKYVKLLVANPQYPYIVFRHDMQSHRAITSIVVDFYDEMRKGLDTPTLDLRSMITRVWRGIYLNLDNFPEVESSVLSTSSSQMRAQTICEYISEHFADDITLDNLAQCASVSRSEVMRCFQKNLSKTPGQYLLEYRLSRACAQLLTTDDPIASIAVSCGFNSASYFTKMFKRYIGSTPKDYRRFAAQRVAQPIA